MESHKRSREGWHAEMPESVLTELQTSRMGLLEEEVLQRREQYGKNAFTEQAPPNILMRIFGQLKSPLTAVLLVAFLVTAALQELVDASVIAMALSIAVIVGVIQEGRASRAFALLSQSQERHATVVRDGKKHVISAAELVVGDIVEIEGGMYVPADVRLIETKDLLVNESPLTGEWMSVNKSADAVAVGTPFAERASMAWMGTFIARGYGTGVVTAIGDSTAVGKLAGAVQEFTDTQTPLQEEMARVSRIMLYIISVAVLVIFILGITRGEPLQEMFLTAIAVAVAAVPEGLPAAVTIILAIGMEALLRRGGLVRNLLAAETLGSTSVILTDKTGTLTKAKMEMTDVIHAARRTEESAQDYRDDARTYAVLNIALCASNAFFDEKDTEDDGLHPVGEPLERAVLVAAQEIGITPAGGSHRGQRIDFLSFSSERRFALGLTQQENGTRRLCINGAPETLLAAASHVRFADDDVRRISAPVREYFTEMLDYHTARGERLIAVSYKDIEAKEIAADSADAEMLEDTIFAGLLVFHDPVREGVSDAIAQVRRAGARVILVTGDNPKTALSIAQQVGIAKKDADPVLGEDIEQMDDATLLRTLDTHTVFARVLPNAKMRLATVLQGRGEVVAMTGDGVNDAPALKRANIGIATGSGTEVAQESSDLVLMNDSFETIVSAVREGRRVVSNLRKIVGYLLSTSFSEVVLIGTALAFGMPVPILPAQILWANIIEEGLMSVAFAFEPGEKNAMERGVRDVRKEGVLSKSMLAFIGMVVAITSSLLLALYGYMLYIDASIEELRSVMFLAVAIDSLFIAFSFRSLTRPLWRINFVSNLFFLVSFVVGAAVLVGALWIPFMRFVLSYEPLPMQDLVLIACFGLFTLITVELGKWLFFERTKTAW